MNIEFLHYNEIPNVENRPLTREVLAEYLPRMKAVFKVGDRIVELPADTEGIGIPEDEGAKIAVLKYLGLSEGSASVLLEDVAIVARGETPEAKIEALTARIERLESIVQILLGAKR